MIDHTRLAHFCIINTHPRAGFDRGSDDLAQLIVNEAGPVKNIALRIIRVVRTNDESFRRLITSGRAFLNRAECARYRYWFYSSCCSLPCDRRTRLRKRQRNNEHASESDNCFLHHDASLLFMIYPNFAVRRLTGRSKASLFSSKSFICVIERVRGFVNVTC